MVRGCLPFVVASALVACEPGGTRPGIQIGQENSTCTLEHQALGLDDPTPLDFTPRDVLPETFPAAVLDYEDDVPPTLLTLTAVWQAAHWVDLAPMDPDSTTPCPDDGRLETTLELTVHTEDGAVSETLAAIGTSQREGQRIRTLGQSQLATSGVREVLDLPELASLRATWSFTDDGSHTGTIRIQHELDGEQIPIASWTSP
ncbi:MAG: hypothetical protein KTR31_09030 [Myxococcales bacterium]|nr:hypothetical protein [Myxococcales bacterium]